MKLLIGFLSLIAIIVSGCTRATDNNQLNSKITLIVPKDIQPAHLKVDGLALPADKKACFGINITGDGIPAFKPGNCGPSVGILGGSVEVGGVISLDITKGSRTFELLLHFVELGAACPDISGGFLASRDNAIKTYVAGKVTQTLSNDNESVNLRIDYVSGQTSIAASNGYSCGGSASLKGTLLSNGDVLTIDSATGLPTVQIYSNPTNDSFYFTNLVDSLRIGVMTAGGMLNLLTSPAQLPPEIFSLTRKPDTGETFALLADGQIVKVDVANSTYSAPSTCPFAVANCKVPVWLQSISAGFGTDLFGLDHGGNIYSLTVNGAGAPVANVDANVTQVSYY